MPQGFIITEWTEDQGLVIKLSYPEDLKIDLDDMMRIFYAHITGAGEAGNVLVRLEKAHCNVSSFFTGMESPKPLMINLMLDLGEDPDMFGEAVIRQMNETILTYLDKMRGGVSETYEIVKELSNYLRNALFLLDRLKNLTKEQRLAQIYSNTKTRTIFEILRERAIARRDLQDQLGEKLNKIISNIEVTLDPFVKTGLVKQDWIEGQSDITLFLLSDFTIFRTPVVKLVEDAKKNLPTPMLATQYLEAVNNFFSTYKPTSEDNLIVAKDLINPDKYDFIILLRERAYPLNKIPKGPGESMEEVSEFLRGLEKDNILKFLRDEKGALWVFLLTDVATKTFYPEYMIDKIRQDRVDKKLKKDVAIKHLELLEAAYQK
jgi:hypothetical protein